MHKSRDELAEYAAREWNRRAAADHMEALEARLEKAREGLTEIYADADNHWALQQPRSAIATIKERARRTLADLDAE